MLPRPVPEPFGGPIRSQIQVGSILIDDRPMIARALAMETESYSGNWSLVVLPEALVLDR